MSSVSRLYHRLPYPLKVAVASVEGWRLARWRYGRRTEEWVEEALGRDRWSVPQWEEWRAERLASLLRHAAAKVPWYREYWARREHRHIDDLSRWPILRKEQVRANPWAFLAVDCRPHRMYRIQTSGTTGTPLRLWWSRETTQRWYAVYEARLRRWNGVCHRDRWAILGGRLVTAARRARPPFWVWNAGLRQLYLSAYHLSDDAAAAYLAAMKEYEVRFLLGYPSALFVLARAAEERGLEAPGLVVVLANAEPLSVLQRGTIERVFRCPVRNSYGMAEIVSAASECEMGRMHLWPEVGVVEEAASLVCTGLMNRDMPFVRYETGDRGRLVEAGDACPCGRPLPLLADLEGRADDVVVTPDGRRVGRLDPVFKGNVPVREAQIIQESRDRIRVLLVPGEGFDERTRGSIRKRLRDRLGEMRIDLEETTRIPRGPNGKFRAVVSRVEDQNRS